MMATTAYLVVILDTEQSPPVAIGAAIWSRNDEYLGKHRAQATVYKADGDDFEGAVQAVEHALAWPHLSWVVPLLEATERSERGEPAVCPDAHRMCEVSF